MNHTALGAGAEFGMLLACFGATLRPKVGEVSKFFERIAAFVRIDLVFNSKMRN